ncbi:hypothetical protein [Acidisoma cladoniae]|uniref:hypothetical protein n=1 Tax=Acidisoma cladoniae TaxID=3040935 RepID=UPI00254B145C|nr:hypothetical protein [Acidisoma sp. PAMC 29798]
MTDAATGFKQQAGEQAASLGYALLDLKRKPPAVYQGKFEPRVLYKAFMALHDNQA